MKKYKINEYLDKMTHKEYSEAIKTIPEMLGISSNTFHNYRKIDIKDSQDIPYRIVCQLELKFRINHGELKNYEITLDTVRMKRKPRNNNLII